MSVNTVKQRSLNPWDTGAFIKYDFAMRYISRCQVKLCKNTLVIVASQNGECMFLEQDACVYVVVVWAERNTS